MSMFNVAFNDRFQRMFLHVGSTFTRNGVTVNMFGCKEGKHPNHTQDGMKSPYQLQYLAPTGGLCGFSLYTITATPLVKDMLTQHRCAVIQCCRFDKGVQQAIINHVSHDIPQFEPIPTYAAHRDVRLFVPDLPETDYAVFVKPSYGARSVGVFKLNKHPKYPMAQMVDTLCPESVDDSSDWLTNAAAFGVPEPVWFGNDDDRREGLNGLSNPIIQKAMDFVKEYRIIMHQSGNCLLLKRRMFGDHVPEGDEYNGYTEPSMSFRYEPRDTMEKPTLYDAMTAVHRLTATSPFISADVGVDANGKWSIIEFSNEYCLSGARFNAGNLWKNHADYLQACIVADLKKTYPEDFV